MMKMRIFLAPAAVALILTAGHASADEVSAENKAAARDLATEGIGLAQQGKCDEAIPKLVRADKLYHAPTILTWIGQCQIEVGRLVEGTETLNRVIREDVSGEAPSAYVAAQAKARELITKARAKIGKLTIEVMPEGLEGVQVSVDERPISNALIGAPKPTDPGKHAVTVTAPGYKSSTQEVELGEGARETLTFTLEVDPNGAPTPAPSTNDAEGTEASADSGPNWVGWATVGVGGALLAGGGVMGFLALDKKNSLECESDGRCSSSQKDTLDSARTNATVSTVLFGVGGAAVVTGVVLLITGKPGSSGETVSKGLTPQVGFGTVGLSGRF